MADDDFRVGERCGIDGCRSRRYRINEAGQEECSNGHQHGLSQALNDIDEDDFIGDNRGKRYRTEKQKAEKVSKVLKGKEAVELYLLAYQLALRKMVRWVLNIKKFPIDFESVVHDLWALRLQNLQSRLHKEAPPGKSADTDEDDTGDDITTRATDLVQPTETELRATTGLKPTKTTGTPNLIQTLATMHLAAQILRIPVLPADWVRWVQSGELIYYEAFRDVPKDMFSRLPTTYQEIFRPATQLEDERFIYELRRLAMMYNKDWNMMFPPLNVPPLLFRLVEELALPLEVYYAARHIAAYMKLSFQYPRYSKLQVNIFDFPEAQLAACIILAVKLFYDLDGIKRIPTSDKDPAAAVIDWDEWTKVMAEKTGALEFHEAQRMTDEKAMELPDPKVDDYLDFFQEHFLVDDPDPKDKDAAFKKMILDMFPISELSNKRSDEHEKAREERKQETVTAMTEALRPNRVITEEESYDLEEKFARPGAILTHHNKIQHVRGRWKIFYDVVAKATGIPAYLLVHLMSKVEALLRQLRAGKRSRVPKKKNEKNENNKKNEKKKNKKHMTNERVASSDLDSDVVSTLGEADRGAAETAVMLNFDDMRSEGNISDITMLDQIPSL